MMVPSAGVRRTAGASDTVATPLFQTRDFNPATQGMGFTNMPRPPPSLQHTHPEGIGAKGCQRRIQRGA